MASEHARAELRREQALLRNRVHRNLAACGGETLAVAPSAPSQQPGWNPPQGDGGAHYPQMYPQGAAPVAARAPQDPALAVTAHTQLQRQLLFFLAQDGASLALPLRPDKLLRLTCDRYPELNQFELSPGNVERALSELHALMPRAVRLERSELVGLDVAVLTEFKRQLVRGMGGNADAADSRAPPVPASSSTRKRAASQAQDDELMEVMSLVDKKSIKQQEKQKGADELLELINKPSAKQAITALPRAVWMALCSAALASPCDGGPPVWLPRLPNVGAARSDPALLFESVLFYSGDRDVALPHGGRIEAEGVLPARHQGRLRALQRHGRSLREDPLPPYHPSAHGRLARRLLIPRHVSTHAHVQVHTLRGDSLL